MSNSTGGIIMSEKMLVTQALDERDLLVKKINDKMFFVKHFSLKKASEFPVFSEGFSLL